MIFWSTETTGHMNHSTESSITRERDGGHTSLETGPCSSLLTIFILIIFIFLISFFTVSNTVHTYMIAVCKYIHNIIQCIVGIMHNWAFPAKNVTLKPASISVHDNLAELVRHSQAQNQPQTLKKLLWNLKIFYLTKFFLTN